MLGTDRRGEPGQAGPHDNQPAEGTHKSQEAGPQGNRSRDPQLRHQDVPGR